ncbi:MAG: NAD(P)-dependent oxidoreductase [Burkholderiaceae bacterium]|nr:NAD(P)-dependent oxidoreductase [Rhodoferax sp.]MCB2004436.1 NAD(P)-dependent oxidoreductase [Rhodoferax sp.]MCB2027262.1 NAD(P)-dependent oxidoreductase [Rhodoferax sp.]MCB2040766.1 NAD(P)-dependent oxidoreductase [Rhodoferax sp.]MCP5260049.1 NAD(P)-dependent oxidoreductase [Rhodoferax sp.]
MPQQHIGFIGASGLMGHGIAKNLLAKGFRLTLTVHHNRERVADLLANGAQEARAPDALGDCDVVILCVTGTPQVEECLLGENGLLPAAKAGMVIIDTSTSEPESTQRLGAQCAARNVVLVDAPLARSAPEAEAGKLNTMVGATPEVFARIEPIFKAYCENIFHVGGPSAGHTIKLLNNFVAQAICTASAEAFAVGAKAGVDLRELVRVISAGGVNSGLFQAMAKTLDGDFSGLTFELDNARKDVRYYGHLAETMVVPAPVGQAVHQSLSIASALGHGAKYVPALVTAQEQLSGARIAPAV